jgi:restriction system protein
MVVSSFLAFVARYPILSIVVIMEAVAVFICAVIMAAVVQFICLWQRNRGGQRLRVHSLGELLALTPTQFEGAVADLLHGMGYRDVRRVGGSGDLAADILCRDDNGRSIVVQCKRYAPGNRVGSPHIQTFIGMLSVHHQADHGIYVTTSEFSRPAQQLAQRHRISLIDGAELSRLFQRVSAIGVVQSSSQKHNTETIG